MPKRKTHEEFIEDLNSKNKYVKPLSKYIKSSEKMEFECLVCGNIFKMSPNSILSKSSCPHCAIEKRTKLRRKTHEQFIKELNNINSNIEVMGDYKNNKTAIKCKCKIDGNIWSAIPSRLLQGSGCPICGTKKIKKALKKDNNQFIEELKQKNPNIIPLEEYINATTKIKLKCKLCGNLWSARPHDLLRGKGCPVCAIKKISQARKKSNITFIKELKKINPFIEILEDYVRGSDKIKYKCNICGNISEIKAQHLLEGIGCNVCSESHMEKMVRQILLENNIDFLMHHTYDGLVGINNGNLSYDFYLPKYNVLIECQGEQHEKPIEFFGGEEQFKIQQEHDRRKKEYANEHNISLLEIWYYEDEECFEDIIFEYLENCGISFN